MSFLQLGLLSTCITLISILLVIKIFPKFGLLDNPKKYGFTRPPVPYGAGIIIPIIFFGISFFIFPIGKAFIGFFIASAILVGVSFYDDYKNISPFLRLFIQCICALIIIYSGIGINEILNPFGDKFDLTNIKLDILGGSFYLIADTLVFFWIIGMINSMNWIDGINGNASGVSAAAGWILFFLSHSPLIAQHDMAQIFLVFACICSVFFFFDIGRPKILMGDAGSMFLGFSLAVFSVIAGGKIATTLMIMIIPIFDAFFTMFRRFKNNKSLFKGDLKHFHHVLLEKGLSRKNAVFIYITICTLFGLPALFFETTGKFVSLIISIIIIFILEISLREAD